MSRAPGKYGNRRPTRNSGSGSAGHAFVGKATTTQTTIKMWQKGKTEGRQTRICPTCNETVFLVKSGALGAHRIGTTTKNSWPCPGEDVGTL